MSRVLPFAHETVRPGERGVHGCTALRLDQLPDRQHLLVRDDYSWKKSRAVALHCFSNFWNVCMNTFNFGKASLDRGMWFQLFAHFYRQCLFDFFPSQSFQL